MNINQNAQPIIVYISFAQEDQGYKDELLKHLNPLVNEQAITTWSRADLRAGDNVMGKIEQNINTANIAILLFSVDYWASDSINEFTQILERYNKGKIRLVPINIRPNTPYKTAISELEVLPKGEKPISSWRDKDEAWESVVQQLCEILNKQTNKSLQYKQEEVIKKQEKKIKPSHIPAILGVIMFMTGIWGELMPEEIPEFFEKNFGSYYLHVWIASGLLLIAASIYLSSRQKDNAALPEENGRRHLAVSPPNYSRLLYCPS